MDQIDGNCMGNFKNTDPPNNRTKNSKVFVKPVEQPEHSRYYNMNHRRRGVALVFNHEKFDVPGCPTRIGTNIDRTNIEIRLKRLGFYVKVYQDLDYDELHKEVRTASRKDYSDCDCFLMVVLTHGDPGILYSKNCAYKYEDLWEPFFNKSCPTLADKPKMFFIQACQGNAVDDGIALYRTETDGRPSSFYLILTHPDVLIAYSTAPGFYSWRRTDEGSWFINALCMELDKMEEGADLLTLLTFVSQRVALDFESRNDGNRKMHLKKQIPCITSTLTRLIKFPKKEFVY